MKKILSGALCLITACFLSGCSGGFDARSSVTLVSREAGSGTRDAFVELTGLLEKTSEGKRDLTSDEAIIVSGTQAVISNVIGNASAIGYISLGSMNDGVKALMVDGVLPSVESVSNGSYAISRPFNIAYAAEQSPLAADFCGYVFSEQAQQIVKQQGYVPMESEPYVKSAISGRLVLAGSSSVSPLMEKLSEAYMAMNPDAVIEIQTTDSSSGISAALSKTCDIAMASRALKDSESALESRTIAMDGIAVIVNNANTIDDLALDDIRALFAGEKTTWSEL